MALFIDARIPVVFGVTPGGADALLIRAADWEAAHPIACACCVSRGPAAHAMDQMFLERVRGKIAWFDRLVVDTSAEAEVRAALEADSVVSARFRLG